MREPETEECAITRKKSAKTRADEPSTETSSAAKSTAKSRAAESSTKASATKPAAHATAKSASHATMETSAHSTMPAAALRHRRQRKKPTDNQESRESSHDTHLQSEIVFWWEAVRILMLRKASEMVISLEFDACYQTERQFLAGAHNRKK